MILIALLTFPDFLRRRLGNLAVVPTIIIFVRATFLLRQTILGVCVLGLLTPFWSLILAALFLLITFIPSLVHCLRIVLSGRVYRDELERLCLRCVEELVL